jgi:hypothetical protein
LAALAALHNATSTLGFGSMSKDSTVRPALVDGTAAGIALIGYLVLIPLFYAWGAILATTIALSLRLAAIYYISQHALKLPYQLRSLLLLTASMLVCLYLLPSAPISLDTAIQILVIMIGFGGVAALLNPLPLPWLQRFNRARLSKH